VLTCAALHAVKASPSLIHPASDLSEAAEYKGPRSNPAAAAEPYVRYRLRDQLQFWQSFCTSIFVLGIIAVGYQLPWANGPPASPYYASNHPSAFQHASFLTQAVETLVQTGAVLAISKKPFAVSPLRVVPKGDNKLRLILDLRFVNSFLKVDPFKYESIRSVVDLCQPNDYLFTVDLKSGYHHIDIHERNWQYLGFKWNGSYYVFCQLPFGWRLPVLFLRRLCVS
jgi:hypothetical protein